MRRIGLFAMVLALSLGTAACSQKESGTDFDLPDIGVIDMSQGDMGADSSMNHPDQGVDAASMCGDGRRHFTEQCDDGNRNDNDGCSSTCMIEEGCARALDLATVGTATARGFSYSGTTTDSFDGAQSTDCLGGANDKIITFTPTSNGTLSVTGTADFDAVFYLRRQCNTPSSETTCDSIEDGSLSAELTAGDPIFIIVDGMFDGDEGSFSLDVAFAAEIAEGGACDPDGIVNYCTTGLLCAPATGGGTGSTCQAGIDLGCGVGTAVTDLTATLGTGSTVSVTGNTSSAPVGAFNGSCGGTGAPQRIYKLTLPYAASVVAQVNASWDAVVYARDATCMGAALTCMDSPPTIEISPHNAGDTVYIFVDGYYSSARGAFSLDVSLLRSLNEGDACTVGSATDRCGAGLLCLTAGSGRTCQAVSGACGVGVQVVDLDPMVVDNRVTYTGDSTVGYTATPTDCSTSSSRAPQVYHKVTMPFTGNVRASITSGFDSVIMLQKGSCNAADPISGSLCEDYPTLEIADVGTVTAGTELYIGVGGWSSGYGPYDLQVNFSRVVGVGEACDPGRLTIRCDTGLMCVATSETEYGCTATADVGCGTGSPVIDITSRIDSGTGIAEFDGTTVGLPNRVDCLGEDYDAGDFWHRIRMPYDGELTINVESEDFSPVVAVRTNCNSAASGSERVCTDEVPVPSTAIGTFTAGTDVFILVDSIYYSSGGEYHLTAQVRPVVGMGQPCSNEEAGPRCLSSLTCRGEEGSATCVVPACGDGYADTGETCDDMNTMAGDGCNATCQLETQGAGGESCSAVVALNMVRTGPISASARAGGSTASATADSAGYCGSSTAAPDHVYSFTLTHTSDVTVSVQPSTGYDAVVYLRGARAMSCDSSMGELRCRDGAASGGAESFTATGLEAGTYYVIIDGHGGTSSNRGTYTLNVVANGV